MRLISVDSHVNEPPETWERVPREFHERGPRIVRNPPGLKGLYMVIEGLKPAAVGSLFTAGKAEKLFHEIENFEWEDWKGPWNPAERLKDMDVDGVEAEVLYPSLTRNLYCLNDAPLQTACLRAYNDWLHDYCSHNPERLLGLAMLSVLDIDWSISELQRCAKLAFKGAMLPSCLAQDQSYASPTFDPLWEIAQDLGLPICFHENTEQGKDRGASPRFGKRGSIERGRWRIRVCMEPQITLSDLMFGLVLERFPRLRFVFAEYELAWVGIFLNMDGAVKRHPIMSGEAISCLPSEYIRRQIYVTFLRDRIGVLGTDVFGADNYMWSNDYPHPVSSWPKSQESAKAVLNGLSDVVQQKLAWENGARLYGLL